MQTGCCILRCTALQPHSTTCLTNCQAADCQLRGRKLAVLPTTDQRQSTSYSWLLHEPLNIGALLSCFPSSLARSGAKSQSAQRSFKVGAHCHPSGTSSGQYPLGCSGSCTPLISTPAQLLHQFWPDSGPEHLAHLATSQAVPSLHSTREQEHRDLCILHLLQAETNVLARSCFSSALLE